MLLGFAHELMNWVVSLCEFLLFLHSVLILSVSFAVISKTFGKGGWYKDFEPEIVRANAIGELFRIKGHCHFELHVVLGMRNVFVERGGTLLFHAGHDCQRKINVALGSGC